MPMSDLLLALKLLLIFGYKLSLRWKQSMYLTDTKNNNEVSDEHKI